MTPSETADLLGMIRVFWPSFGDGDAGREIAAWHLVMGDVAFEDAQYGFRVYMRSGGQFPPKPSDLIREIASAHVGSLVPDAAWGEVRKEINRHPYGVKTVYDPVTQRSIPNPGPQFSHPLIAEAVEATGWELICRCDDEAEIKKQFTFTLKRLLEREIKEQAAKPQRLVSLEDATAPIRAIGGGR